MCRVQVFQGEHSGVGVVGEYAGRGAGHDAGGCFQPGGLKGVAVYGRPPVLGHLQFGQRPFDANRSPSEMDEPDIGSYTAGQFLENRRFAFVRQSGPVQHFQEFNGFFIHWGRKS